MKKNRLTIAGIVAVLALAAVPFLYAGRGRHHEGRGGFGPLGHLERAQKELGLSDQQVTEIKAIFANLREENAQYRKQMHGGFEGVLNTLIQNPNDVAGAQAIMDQQAQAERATKANLLTAASKALNVLTADQRVKLGQLVSERRARFQRF